MGFFNLFRFLYTLRNVRIVYLSATGRPVLAL
jgi:hypothetical protein